MAKKKLLLDVDCGLDDAQAMVIALASPNVQILGITCCHGNTTIDNVCRNVLRVLKACQRTEIPVFRGTCSSLLGQHLDSSTYHGKDGLGDVPDPNAPGLEHSQTEHVVNAMIWIVTEHNGQISLVAIGPLTNLALTIKMDPTFSTKLKHLYIMEEIWKLFWTGILRPSASRNVTGGEKAQINSQREHNGLWGVQLCNRPRSSFHCPESVRLSNVYSHVGVH
ncbi:uncharacterized protein [Heptranchias perlo]|uniref:uncharacterized protein n=1 Tax=Heptranchias perlo TaxID=212740 RepID=UPI00355A216B